MTAAPPVKAGEPLGGLALLPSGFGPWRCKRLAMTDDGQELTVRFERDGGSDWLEVVVFPPGASRRPFKRLERCAVAYRGALSVKTESAREEIASLVLAVAASIDSRLREPGVTIAEALGRKRELRKLVFSRDALFGLLSPDIAKDVATAGGFSLVDVYPTSYLRQSATDELVLVLDFRREADGRRMLFEVARRKDDRPALATTTNFTLTHLSLGAAVPEGGDELSALLSFVLQLRDHGGLTVEFPDATSDVSLRLSAGETPDEPAETDSVLNLAINAACGQSCSFCSVQELSPPADGGDRTYARLASDLESNRRRGVEHVRINGYDPLAYSRIVDVLRLATRLGFTRADVFSPCTRLADADFCRTVVDALPKTRRFFVPVYGGGAGAHDAVVGTPGAFERVSAALANLRTLVPAQDITLIGVATRNGLDGLLGAARWASSIGLGFSAHLPYPSAESVTDRYFTSAPRQTDVARVMASAFEQGHRLLVHGVAPCVTLRAMTERGIPVSAWLPLEPAAHHALPGTEYREQRFVHRAAEAGQSAFQAQSIPCAHVPECALSASCPRELLAAYLRAHGSEEFRPVSVAALLAGERGEREL